MWEQSGVNPKTYTRDLTTKTKVTLSFDRGDNNEFTLTIRSLEIKKSFLRKNQETEGKYLQRLFKNIDKCLENGLAIQIVPSEN